MSFVPEITISTVQLQVNISSWIAGHHSHVAKLEEDVNMGSTISTIRESSHCQNIHGANNWSLVLIPKHWSKVVCAGSYFLIVFFFFKPPNSKNAGKLKTWGEGQGGWRKKRLCLPSHGSSTADTLCHALVLGWFACPSSSGCWRQKLSPLAYGSVCATTVLFCFVYHTNPPQEYKCIIKGKKIPEMNFKAIKKADHKSEMWIGIVLGRFVLSQQEVKCCWFLVRFTLSVLRK